MSGEPLVMLIACDGAVPPTRAARFTDEVLMTGLASLYTLPETVMFCDGRDTEQLLVHPFGVESDCSATVAMPLWAPAVAVLRPAMRLVVSVDPGAKRLIMPLFEVAGPTAESLSSRIPASCAREETPESRGMPCLFLNTERGFGGQKS